MMGAAASSNFAERDKASEFVTDKLEPGGGGVRPLPRKKEKAPRFSNS